MDCRNIHRSHFSFLERSIEILIVEDMPAECDVYEGFLNSYKLYNVTCVSTAHEANALLLEKRFHVCLTDLGICDINGDEYYLLRTFSSRLPFIVVTARDSLEYGFEVRKLGAFAAIKKPINFLNLNLIRLINEAILHGVFKYKVTENYKRVIIDAINVLVETKPANMKQWVERLGVEERYLRKVWVDCFEYRPRLVFTLYQVFVEAFAYYNRVFSQEFKFEGTEDGRVIDIKKNEVKTEAIVRVMLSKRQKDFEAMIKNN
jgi:CheY-like chemotaxis protein